MFDKQKIKKIFFFNLLISFVPAAFLFFAWYLGFFSEVVIRETTKPKVNIVALPHQGNYQKIGKKIIQVREFLSAQKIPCQPAAVYYDDEEKVIKKNLRSAGGCVVRSLPKDLPRGYQVIGFEPAKTLEAMVESHPGVAKLKLFSAIRKHTKETSTPLRFPIIALFNGKNCLLYFYTKDGSQAQSKTPTPISR